MTTPDPGSAPARMLLAREAEQLDRIADRIRQGRRVLAFLACGADLRGEALAWLAKATGKALVAPEESDAEALLARLESAARGRPGQVVSISWSPGDRGAVAALNLHREKLRRGASILVWCAPQDVGVLRTEGQDAYSFRDTLVFLAGFTVPSVHVPTDDTPELRLARARLDLPGTPFEKALAAADLGTLLLDRGYYREAADVCVQAIQPFVKDGVHEEAGRGTIAYLTGTLAAALAAVGSVSEARRWAEVALASRIETGAEPGLDLGMFRDAIEPTSEDPFAAARVLHGAAEHLAWEPFQRHVSLSLAEAIARLGALRAWSASDKAFPADDLETRGVIALARGDVDEATELWESAANGAKRRDEDNRAQLFRVLDGLVARGEIRCAVALGGALRKSRSTDWLPLYFRSRVAWMSTLGGHVERARALLHFDKRPSPLPDGVVSHRCATLTRVTAAAGGAGRLAAEKIERTVSYLGEVLGWFPPPAEGTPPFYRILLPGLQADLLCMLPDRRAGALDLARRAWELASAAYPRYVPSHAAKLARCLLLLDRHGEALDFLAGAEEEAVTQENLRALSALRALRVVAHVRGGDGAQSVDSAMTALRDTLHATGSPRIAAETLLDLARALPPARAQPDILALLDEASELFSEMPMPLQEELCRETRGDVLLARGRRDEAAACFAAAAKRSSHYGLLLRVPLLVQKHRHALGEPAAPGTAAVQDRDRILPP